jgi:nicotianamine synthase
MDNCQEVMVEKVCKIYDKLSRLGNLNPSTQVNDLFTQLVRTCTTPCHEFDITQLSQEIKEKIAKLITLCGKAEGLLESHYSTLIGSNENPLNHVKIFPYYKNYLKLTHLEFTMLTKVQTHHSSSFKTCLYWLWPTSSNLNHVSNLLPNKNMFP